MYYITEITLLLLLIIITIIIIVIIIIITLISSYTIHNYAQLSKHQHPMEAGSPEK